MNWHKTNYALLEPFFEAYDVDIFPTMAWLKTGETRPHLPAVLKLILFLYLESDSRESFRTRVMDVGLALKELAEDV